MPVGEGDIGGEKVRVCVCTFSMNVDHISLLLMGLSAASLPDPVLGVLTPPVPITPAANTCCQSGEKGEKGSRLYIPSPRAASRHPSDLCSCNI